MTHHFLAVCVLVLLASLKVWSWVVTWRAEHERMAGVRRADRLIEYTRPRGDR